MKKVEIKAKRTTITSKEIIRIIPVVIVGTDTEIKNHAKLEFLNEYINGDSQIATFNNVNQAQAFAKLKVTAKII